MLTGHFKDDVVDGEGQFRWLDGRYYRGQFKESKFDGEGHIYFPEGNSLFGTWKDGQSVHLKAVFSSHKDKGNSMIRGMFDSVMKDSAHTIGKKEGNTGNDRPVSSGYNASQPSIKVSQAKESGLHQTGQHYTPYESGVKTSNIKESTTRPYQGYN